MGSFTTSLTGTMVPSAFDIWRDRHHPGRFGQQLFELVDQEIAFVVTGAHLSTAP